VVSIKIKYGWNTLVRHLIDPFDFALGLTPHRGFLWQMFKPLQRREQYDGVCECTFRLTCMHVQS